MSPIESFSTDSLTFSQQSREQRGPHPGWVCERDPQQQTVIVQSRLLVMFSVWKLIKGIFFSIMKHIFLVKRLKDIYELFIDTFMWVRGVTYSSTSSSSTMIWDHFRLLRLSAYYKEGDFQIDISKWLPILSWHQSLTISPQLPSDFSHFTCDMWWSDVHRCQGVNRSEREFSFSFISHEYDFKGRAS